MAPGDMLYAIARRQGVAFPAVARANGITDPNIVRAGAVLTIPIRFIIPALRDEGVVINIPEFRLYLFRGGEVRSVYPVTVGLPTWETPLGPFVVTNRVENPTWYMPRELARREKVQREIVPPGSENPLGDYWIGTSLKHTGIHSTNSPMTIGLALSHGCIRLYPEHIKTLFWDVKPGERGEVLYKLVKVAADGKDILVEIHPDVYGRTPDLFRAAEEELRAAGLWQNVDFARLRDAVAEARGIPVPVGAR
ncbi:MAG: L,D-transpeptidase family protein [Candidatus Eisenbacteria bacterium]